MRVNSVATRALRVGDYYLNQENCSSLERLTQDDGRGSEAWRGSGDGTLKGTGEEIQAHLA